MNATAKTICALMYMGVLTFNNTAHAWTFPISDGYTLLNGFWSCSNGCYHLGQDIPAPAGTEVHAICTGTVKEVTYNPNPPRRNYGGRVLVECETEEVGTITVLYGHLGPNTSNPATDDIFVTVGEAVEEDQVIGRLGTRAENGGYGPHLHLATHREEYLGGVYECGGWTYGGYTSRAYEPSDSCYCGVMDNWFDPMELLGMSEKNLRITAGSVSPRTGETNSTQFTWHVETTGGRRLEVSASVLIYHPVRQSEYAFEMPVVSRNEETTVFEYTGRVLGSGTYEYRFHISTCADETEEESRRQGPVVSTPPTQNCRPQPESCNNRDDNCNGTVDEDLFQEDGSTCGIWVNVCENGQWVEGDHRDPTPEECNGMDDDCDHHTDEDLERSCETVCGRGHSQCDRGEWTYCSAGEPEPERCDGWDNDCDGERDEDIVVPCTSICGQGTQTCYRPWTGVYFTPCTAPQPQDEVCDGLDNDCDGMTDEELVETYWNPCYPYPVWCVIGEWMAEEHQEPEEEVCNNYDDDCDGAVDDYVAVRECETVCGQGVEWCLFGEWICNTRKPLSERCNGVDDDCDGITDEDAGQSCGCYYSGIQYCVNGTLSVCSEEPCPPPPPTPRPTPPPTPPRCTPSTEQCDNLDNDCDGITDEDLMRGCSNECGNTGIQRCYYGGWNPCTANNCQPPPPTPRPTPRPSPTPPRCTPNTEQCDNLDNDCDGITDEDLMRGCSNECGNTGIQRCYYGGWNPCTANTCQPPTPRPTLPPTPPQPPTDRPNLSSPSTGYIKEVAIGGSGSVTLRWQTVARATEYEYLISYGGPIQSSGATIVRARTSGTSYDLSTMTNNYGTQLHWRVRGVNIADTGPWSEVRTLYFSYPVGTIVVCSSSSCPSQNAWYQISRDVDDQGLPAVPPLLIADYINSGCVRGRTATPVPYEAMSGYRRSARAGGCP
ncbi:MAG: M23 family metallopeptidase [Patescibacteria group bacterium]